MTKDLEDPVELVSVLGRREAAGHGDQHAAISPTHLVLVAEASVSGLVLISANNSLTTLRLRHGVGRRRAVCHWKQPAVKGTISTSTPPLPTHVPGVDVERLEHVRTGVDSRQPARLVDPTQEERHAVFPPSST